MSEPKELIIWDKDGKRITIQEFLDKLTYYFSLSSLDGKPERQKLRAEIKKMIEKSAILDLSKEPF